jgi:hypothetical protein
MAGRLDTVAKANAYMKLVDRLMPSMQVTAIKVAVEAARASKEATLFKSKLFRPWVLKFERTILLMA